MWNAYCGSLFNFWRNPFGSGGVFMMFLWLIILGIVIYAAYMVVNRSKPAVNSKENALDILKKRYAGGEISRKEYEEKKKEIID